MQPETFSRTITKLVKRGLLRRLGARQLEVLDHDGLRAAAAPPGSQETAHS